MAERNRTDLKNEFRDGERPTGGDFADLMDSFVNKLDDQIDIDGDGNVDIPQGLNLKNTTNGIAGTLRFNGGAVQVNDGATWTDIGGGGAFEEVDGGPEVAYADGNVGIGDFSSSPPTHRLEVELGANSGEGERVRLGNAAIANGLGATAADAQFSHVRHASNSNFALRQRLSGEVLLNAPTGQDLRFTHNRTNTRLLIDQDGIVIVNRNNAVGSAEFQVEGDACKTGGGNWSNCSDMRMKKDIEPFEDGLNKLMQVRPVKFKYDGSLNTDPEKEEVGVIGQEMEALFPYMTTRSEVEESKFDGGLLMYNSGALTYVLVNAVQELTERVKHLEHIIEKNQIEKSSSQPEKRQPKGQA